MWLRAISACICTGSGWARGVRPAAGPLLRHASACHKNAACDCSEAAAVRSDMSVRVILRPPFRGHDTEDDGQRSKLGWGKSNCVHVLFQGVSDETC